MTISGSLSTALSGLSAVSRAAEVVSSNISNALTEGYGKREIQLSPRVLGGSGTGVRIDGVTRYADPVLTGSRRQSEAQLGQASVQADFLISIEAAIGSPDQAGSLTARLTELESALVEASSRPDSDPRLQQVVQAANGVARHLNSISDEVQTERLRADQAIDRAVDDLNTSLRQVATLNARIVQFSGTGQDVSALVDQRQRTIDGISDLVPLREVPRDNGTIALFTPGGAILLDGKAADISFSPVGTITPDMTLASGALAGLTINGQPVSTDAANGPIAGGKLAGLFEMRDAQAPAVQAKLDAVARDLVERFQDPGVDPTVAVGDAGLFTDGGSAFLASNETGLAGRIALNTAVDPSEGGNVWRLRDGIGAASPGQTGNAALLNAFTDTLTANRTPASGGFSVPRSAVGLAGDFLSGVSVQAERALSERGFAHAQTDTLISAELGGGVDTDDEMRKLLVIEQAFAANARVISTIDEMIQTLLRL